MPRKSHGAARSATDRRSTTRRPRGDRAPTAAHSLLIRLWRELRDDDSGAPIWRGTVSDLRGRQLGSFSSIADPEPILDEMSGATVLLRFSCEGMTPQRKPEDTA